MVKKYELTSQDLMSASEASVRWGYDEGYVRQQLSKYPEKFKMGTIRKFGKTYIITRDGMEHLTGKTEKEVNKNEWLVRHEKNWIVDFEQIVATEDEAKKLTALKATEELETLGIPLMFEKVGNKDKYCLKLKNNSIYSYEKKV